MDTEPEKGTEQKGTELPKPVIPPPFIPPPVISPPPPPPPSPLDRLPKSTPPPVRGDLAVNVRIRTPEEDGFARPRGLAPLNTRLIAVLIDWVVIIGVVILIGKIAPWLGAFGTWFLSSAYMLTRDSLPFLEGQSVGKKAMKIQAVTLDGQSLAGKWEQGAIRNISMIIPLVPLVELYLLLTRDGGPDRGKRLGDEWAKTKVIVAEIPEISQNPSEEA